MATLFALIEHGDSDSYGLCLDIFIFSSGSWDWLICLCILSLVLPSSCWLGYTTLCSGIAGMESIFHWSIATLSVFYTGTYPSFRGRLDWFFMLEHLISDMEITGLFHVILITYWGITTLLDVLTSRLDLLIMIVAFDGLWSYWHLRFSLLSILGWSPIPTYLSFHTQTFHLWYFHTYIYPTKVWSFPSILHISLWHMTSHPSLD